MDYIRNRKTIREWCIELGVNPISVYEAIARGMSLKQALEYCGAVIDEDEEYDSIVGK